MKAATAVIISVLFSCSAVTLENIGQCVYPKTVSAKDGSLKFKATVFIYDKPDLNSDKVILKTFEAFSIGAETNNGFIQLVATPGWEAPPNGNAGQIVGWSKLSDFDFQDVRNCN